MMKNNTTPARGVRNNNPGNIRLSKSFTWKGEMTQGLDKDFCVFDKMENGLRAIFRLLANYHILHGVNTIAQIFQRYAPPSENHTTVYAQWVVDAMRDKGFKKVNLDTTLNWHDRLEMMALVECICQYESRYVPGLVDLYRAYDCGMGQLIVPSDLDPDVCKT